MLAGNDAFDGWGNFRATYYDSSIGSTQTQYINIRHAIHGSTPVGSMLTCSVLWCSVSQSSPGIITWHETLMIAKGWACQNVFVLHIVGPPFSLTFGGNFGSDSSTQHGTVCHRPRQRVHSVC